MTLFALQRELVQTLPYLRRLIIDNVSRAFGVFLDEELNSIRSDENRVISHQYSQIKVMVIPTNEEVMIAKRYS